MNRLIRMLTILAALLVLGAGTTLAQAEDEGLFRFVHAVPGVGDVDVYIDGQLSVVDLSFGEGSNYLRVPAGTREVIVRPAGLTTELWRQQVQSTADLPVTLIASSIDPLTFEVFEDDFTPVAPGTTRLRAIHAIEGAPPVDISSAGQPVVTDLAYNSASGGFDIQADVYPLTVDTADGTTLVSDVPFALASNTSYMIVLAGTANAPQPITLSAPIGAEGETGFVRIAHTVSDAPPVDIYVDGALLIPALAFGEATEHLLLPAADYSVELRAAGTTEPLLEASLTVTAGEAITIAAVGTVDTLDVNVFTDAVADVDPGTAVVSIVNTIPDTTASVTLADGTALADGIEFNTAGDAVSLEPIADAGTLSLNVEGQSQDIALPITTFYGGVYINGFIVLDTSGAFPQPMVMYYETALAQGIASAPEAEAMVAMTEPETMAEPETEEAPTEPPVEVVVTAETTEAAPAAPAEPTPAPQPTVAPAQPAVTTPVPAGPTARINLNPDANLQLRQRPNADALSLGLAPSGTILEVIGREGEPVDLEGEPLDLDYVDPATLLEDEDADLDPTATWLYVTYNTPDGGEIDAWVNAQYLVVRDERGDLMKLRDLPTVPGNRAGEATNTAITPPPVPDQRVLIRTINLNPGVNLNIRRTPETTGEVIGGVPNNTVAELLGVTEDREWAYIQYEPAEGGTITGWVSDNFIQYEYQNRIVDLDELEQRELLEIIPADRRGSISADAPARAAPTQDPTRDAYLATVQINPGANLNLRRTPDAQSEVVAQVPSQAQVIVDGRTEDELWLRTTYEDQQGWIASAFVTVTFNGTPVNVTEIPVISTEADTAG
ncbi:MAG: DUF4397 domain-containing protein [Chloroflexota bacterium]